MLIKKTAASLAAGAVISLFISVGTAQAGAPSMIINPSPSMAGETVTLAWGYSSSCAGSEYEFRDITGGGSKALCQGTMDANGIASCTTNSLTDVGMRSIEAFKITGTCLASSSMANSHTVTVAPVAVPTTSEWTLWGLMGLLLIGGGVFASRRFRVAAG